MIGGDYRIIIIFNTIESSGYQANESIRSQVLARLERNINKGRVCIQLHNGFDDDDEYKGRGLIFMASTYVERDL